MHGMSIRLSAAPHKSGKSQAASPTASTPTAWLANFDTKLNSASNAMAPQTIDSERAAIKLNPNIRNQAANSRIWIGGTT